MRNDGDGCDGIDLDRIMAPLNRDSLEMVLALCIEQHADCFDLLLNELQKPADLTAVDDVAELFDEDIDEAFSSLLEVVERAQSYTESDCLTNASAILASVTRCLADHVSALQPEGESSRTAFWVTLEQSWDALFAKLSDYDQMKALFKDLAGWRQALVHCAGPVFSEPLRLLKSRIENVRASRPSKRAKGGSGVPG